MEDKKWRILEVLRLESEPISLPDLLLKLDITYKERTVRRWLKQLSEEGAIERLGEKRSTKYRVIEREREHSETSSCFSSNSLLILDKIRRPLFARLPVTYAREWVNGYIPNSTFYLPIEMRQQLLDAGKRSRDHEPAGTYARQIYNRLLIDLSYNSSRLEGNTYSLLDTERLLFQGNSAEGKLEEETVMILNHKEAIRYVIENARRLEVSENTIYTLHFLLSEGLIESKYAGKVRDHSVRIGGSTYIPYEDPKQLQMQFGVIIQKASKIEDPFEQSFFLLAHVSYLQAFSDVNKRTARLAANISLVKENLVPLAFKNIEIEDYVSAMLSIYELQEVKPLVDLYAFSYFRTCIAYDETIKSFGIDEVRVRYRTQRRALVREIILQGLTGPKMNKYLSSEAEKRIPEVDRLAVIEDVLEDLEHIDENRLVGLGVTPQQLTDWLNLFN